MKKVINVVAVMFLISMLIGCASTSSLRFGEDTTTSLRGKTEQQIVDRFGKPYKKYTASDGSKVLEYRQPTADRGGYNTFLSVGSFGFLSGQSSAFVDIMKLYFKGKVVKKASFEENVQGITMPGM